MEYINNAINASHIADMISCAALYQSNFENKNITYIYIGESNKRQELVLSARDNHFMHLCGVGCYNEKYSKKAKGSRDFYKACLNGTLEPKKIWIKKKKIVDSKLLALKSLPLILNGKVSITGKGVFELLEYTNAIRTNQNILALGLEGPSPKSIINLSINKSDSRALSRGGRVIRIEIYDLATKQKPRVIVPPQPKKKKKKNK